MTYALFNLEERENRQLEREKERDNVTDRVRATVSCVIAEKLSEREVRDRLGTNTREREIKMQKGGRLQN